MITAPVVSVVMVFHRMNGFMQQAIGSVLNQTFRDLELILVDNGTGVRSEAFGEVGRDPRVRFVRLPRNEGIPGGHNAGVAAARGEFIALLDYDDLMLPGRLERQVEALRADPQLGLISSLVRRIDEQDRVIGQEFTLLDAREQYEYSQYAAPFPTPACTGRREVFAALPYRTEFSFAADFDFHARVVERYRTTALDEVLFHYRWYAAQTTQDKAAAIEQDRAAIRLMTARRRAGRGEQPEQVRLAIRYGTPDVCAASRRAGELSLAEGFYALAAYQARRMLAAKPMPGVAFLAFSLGMRAICAAGGRDRWLAARMFFSGPVRALGVRPGSIKGSSVPGAV